MSLGQGKAKHRRPPDQRVRNKPKLASTALKGYSLEDTEGLDKVETISEHREDSRKESPKKRQRVNETQTNAWEDAETDPAGAFTAKTHGYN